MNLPRDGRLAALRRRRAMLVDRAADERATLAAARERLEHPLHWFDVGMDFAGSLRTGPKIMGIPAFAGMLALSSRLPRLRTWLARGLMVYQVGRFLHAHLGQKAQALH
ncbi:MAG TPA: hypothetical protein VHP13_07515 [Gammaproteobacteria bacterium]|nr:hypothetical protein [Gammaproteobacteria bacterium]